MANCRTPTAFVCGEGYGGLHEDGHDIVEFEEDIGSSEILMVQQASDCEESCNEDVDYNTRDRY